MKNIENEVGDGKAKKPQRKESYRRESSIRNGV